MFSKFRKSIEKITSVVVSLSMCMTIIETIPVNNVFAETQNDCIVDTSIEYQTIRGFGGINLPEWIGDLTDTQVQTAYGNGDNELGLDILRIFVNDDKNQWYKAIPVAKKVIASGGIVFATPWNPPSDMCETFTRYSKAWDGSTVVKENQKRLRHDKYGEYAQHLNDFVHYMRDNGVDLYAISIQNEPDYGEEWTWWTEDECMNFIENYAGSIDCAVISPESFSYNKSYYDNILNSDTAMKNIDIFGTHFYGTSRDRMAYPLMQEKGQGKEIWMTEVYTPNSNANSADLWPEAINVSTNIHDGLVVGNMSAYVWWYIRRSYGLIKEDGNISKRGYCMAQYSKFVRPDAIRVDATETPTDDIKVSAYKNDNQVVVVAINSGDSSVVQHFNLTNENDSLLEVERYRTSATENLLKTDNMDITDNGFWATLPAESVTTFVATISDVIDVQPDENGYYFHDTFENSTCDWSVRGSNTIGLSGRTPYMGDNALLVSERTATWNGAEKSLESLGFKSGNTYCFSACVEYLEGETSEKFALTLQYTDADGKTRYSNIDTKTAVKGNYVQLYNPSYTIPEDATNIKLVIETSSQTMNFYIDEVIGAVQETIIDGPKEIEVPKASNLGDVNLDENINLLDVCALKNGLMYDFTNENSKLNADINQDDKISSMDLLLLKKYIFEIISGFNQSE